jgi:hypothetical protein
MNMAANELRPSLLVRMGLVFLITVLVDALVVWLVPHPLHWAGLIGASISLSMAVFVIIPLIRHSSPAR